MISVGGEILYSLIGESNFTRQPLLRDPRCDGLDVPVSIEANKIINFCTCVHLKGNRVKEENYNYCINQFTNKEDQNLLNR